MTHEGLRADVLVQSAIASPAFGRTRGHAFRWVSWDQRQREHTANQGAS